jgi:hypothetical protein
MGRTVAIVPAADEAKLILGGQASVVAGGADLTLAEAVLSRPVHR